MKKFLKKIKGSELVEKLLMVCFSLAAGAGVVALVIARINEANEDQTINGADGTLTPAA